jgi:Leucine-rich repeat (LRR) protein
MGGIKHLTKLTTLKLADNRRITSDGISHLNNLTALDLSRNRVISNFAIQRLTKLVVLSLSFNFSITDDGLSGLTNLTVLYLIGSQITDHGLKGSPKAVMIRKWLSNTDVDSLHLQT